MTAAQEPITDRLDAVSRALSRAVGMVLATGQTDIVNVIVEAGVALDDVINELLEDEADGAAVRAVLADPDEVHTPARDVFETLGLAQDGGQADG